MHIFISGSTGYIGNALAKKLADEGNVIRALCRDTNTTVLRHPGIRIFEGDITDQISVQKAMEGCEQVYHLAAYAKVWSKDPTVFYRLNVGGTKNILDAAMSLGIQKIVFTSTAGTLGPSGKFPVREEDERVGEPFTEYEKSKMQAEALCREYSNKYGLNIVMVNPARVYGPGILTESNAVTRLIKLFLADKWKIIPGDGKRTGSYVYIDDIVNGHVLAMEKGRSGERYNLAGVNATYIEFFDLLADIIGKKNSMFKLPVWAMLPAGHAMQFYSKLTGKAPLLTPAWIRKYYYDWSINSEKARRELGYSFISLEEGLQKTVDWLRNKQ